MTPTVRHVANPPVRLLPHALAFALVAACATEPRPQPPAASAPVVTAASAPPPAPSAAPVATGAAAVEATSPSPASQVASVHGLKMYWERRGAVGPVVVLLHGGLGSVGLWPEALEHFARTYRVIAPEQMGHGHTPDDPGRKFDYHAMAEDTVELLRQQNIDSAFFLGWSDGGNIALDIAADHPALVRKLATTGANIRPLSDPESVAWVKHVKAECGPNDKPMADCLPPFLREAYAKSAPDVGHFSAFVERVKKMWLTQPNMTKAQLAKIKAPALIVAGDHDMISLRETTEIFQSIAGARLWIVPDSTHFVPKERAELFNATVGAFFEEAPPAKP